MKLTAKNIWFTSDTHYGHKNICRGVTSWKSEDPAALIAATRDFPTLEIMNETIVSNINSVVAEDDWLIHLGDWSFGGIENIDAFRDQIA
jgi:calcineurin-like phosphoesterase family protein